MSIDYEKMEQDISWIQKAVEDPSYLLVKGDNGNMFELSDDTEGYIREVISTFKERGYNVYRSGRFISLEKK